MDKNGNELSMCAGDLGYTSPFLDTLFQRDRSGTLLESPQDTLKNTRMTSLNLTDTREEGIDLAYSFKNN